MSSEDDTERLLEAWRSVEDGIKSCDKHGRYESHLLKHHRPQVQAFWTGCPDCNEVYERQAQEINERYQRCMVREATESEDLTFQANVPSRYRDVDITKWTPANPKMRGVVKAVQDYCTCFDLAIERGQDLIFTGPPGTGKTYAACGIVNHLIRNSHSAYYTTASEFLVRLRNTYQHDREESERDVYEAMLEPDLLVLDEVGRHTDSEHSSSSLFNLLDMRYREVKPTVIVTNMAKETLSEFFGPAMMSRLRQGGSMLGFHWDDLRSNK